MTLSASSEPFYIYNNGVPVLVPVDTTTILDGIPDICHEYPPDAAEAAEMECVEQFVDNLVELEMWEEREERMRRRMSMHQKMKTLRHHSRRHIHNLSLPPNSIVPLHRPQSKHHQHLQRHTSNENVHSFRTQRRHHLSTPIQQPRKHN